MLQIGLSNLQARTACCNKQKPLELTYCQERQVLRLCMLDKKIEGFRRKKRYKNIQLLEIKLKKKLRCPISKKEIKILIFLTFFHSSKGLLKHPGVLFFFRLSINF